jgi:hypothetical protein
MNKDEKTVSSKDLKIKEAQDISKKYHKINKKYIQENSMKDICQSFKEKYMTKYNGKEKVLNNNLLNGTEKFSKNLEKNNRNLNKIDITMNFNLTNFTTYHDIRKAADKKLIENYSGKKNFFHKRQISDGYQRIKVINTGNYVNIKVNTKGNRTNTNKEIEDSRKMNSKNKVFKTHYINYDIEDNEKINKTNNYISNSHKDIYLLDKNSNLNLNVDNSSNNKNFQKIEKKFKKNKINIHYIDTAKSVLNLNKAKNDKIKNNINMKIDKNFFAKKIMLNNKLIRYKTFKNSMSECRKNPKTETSKKLISGNAIKERVKESKKLGLTNNYDIILSENKIKIFPLNDNKNINKKNNKFKFNNSCDGLNNIKGQNLFKKVAINLNTTSRNNTNRDSTNFITDKNKVNEEENILGYNKDENNPEINFFNIVKLIQKSKYCE